MRRVEVNSLKGQEILGKEILDEAGRVLLNKGVQLNAHFIGRLEFVIDEILSRPEVMIMANEIRSKDDGIFSHCANVCSMSVVLGLSLGMDMNVIKEMSIGALLHDVGKIEIMKEIDKTGKSTLKTLSSEDQEKVHLTHSRKGYELLDKNLEFNPITKVVEGIISSN